MRVRRVPFLFLLLLVALPGFAGEERPPDTLWDSVQGQRHLTFMPEAVLERELSSGLPSLSNFPLSAEMILRRAQSAPLAGSSDKTRCSMGVIGAVISGTNQSAPDGVPGLRTRTIVVAGHVNRLVVGMEADGEVATLVHLRADRVVKGVFVVHVGDDVTFLEEVGRITVSGHEMCNVRQDFVPVEKGDEIVIGGEPDPDNPGHLELDEHLVFYVRDGRVVPAVHGSETDSLFVEGLDRLLNPEMSR